MIIGLGSDLIDIRRIEKTLERHGERFLNRVFTDIERRKSDRRAARAASYAKRFAAKEAFGKALGTGVAVPATLHAVAVVHDARGKPEYRYDERLAAHMRDNALRAHLSISDEDEHIVAFALIERA